MSIVIAKRVERRITLSAEDIYAALEKHLDFPAASKNAHIGFDDVDGMIGSEITIIVTDGWEETHAS